MSTKRYRRKKTAEKSQYYTYGNVAYELQPTPSAPRVREREREKRRKQRARAAKAAARERRMLSFKAIVAALILFAGSIAFMGVNVVVHNAEVSLRKQKSELEDLRASNAILEAELTEQIDLEYIRKEATERLGMSEPQSYQVVHIDVPKQSYTMQHAADDTVPETSWFSELLKLLKKE